jgi:pimeloyl-ACP methyl ester carboxylesterase
MGQGSKKKFAWALAATGRAITDAAKYLGRKAADAYRSIDPDVQRHLVQLPALAFSLLSNGDEVKPGRPDGHTPVVFVPGLGASGATFRLMRWYLGLHGFRRCYPIRFASDMTLRERARHLARRVRDVRRATGSAKVDLVAHSLGGIVARLAIADGRLGSSVRTLVTLGSPHQGTYPARYGNTEILRDLRPDSEFLARLSGRPLPARLRVVCLWSRNDLFVLPSESAVLPGSQAIDLTPATHYSYLLHPAVFERVRQILSTQP